MRYTWELQTAGYRVVFQGQPTPSSYLDTTIEVHLDPSLGGVIGASSPTFLSIHDMHRFLEYLEAHMTQVQHTPHHRSATFVPLELGFQAQALSGNIVAPDDGAFTLRFMVHVGNDPIEDTRVYVGGEALVDVVKVYQFIAACRVILDTLE